MTDRIERVRQILAFEFGWSRSTPIADSEQHAETITQQIRALYKPRGGVMDELLLTDEEIKTNEMPCDEDKRECPLNPENSYNPCSIECQLCGHRITAIAQLAHCEPIIRADERAIIREKVKGLENPCRQISIVRMSEPDSDDTAWSAFEACRQAILKLLE